MGSSEIIGSVLNPYEILGLSKDASASAIRTSYKKLALQYHPDKTRDESLKTENSKRFQEVQEAYEILSDTRRRREYDEEQEIEAQIQEHRRKEKEMREKAKRQSTAKQRERDEDYRRRDAERKQYDANRRAEKEYEHAKKRENEQMAAALQAQALRKQQADAKLAAQEEGFRREAEREKLKREPRESREERKRKDAEAKRLQDEVDQKREDLQREAQRLLAEEDRKRRESDKSKREKDRRKERVSKSEKYDSAIYDDLDPEPVRLDRSDRGRGSKERLREPLAVPRDNSRRRDGSRGRVPRDRSPLVRDNSRHREIPISDIPRDRERDRVRRADIYESSPRRMSTEPLHSEYLRTPPMPAYGSPPTQSSSYYSPAGYSPPPSPRPRNSMPAMTSSQSYSAKDYPKEKGRDRTRDRPSANARKHSEIPSYSGREPTYIPIISDDLDHATPGNRDSGYSTSSNTTPLKETGPRQSSERVNSDTTTPGKKYKWVMMPVSDDEGSAVGSESTAKPHRRPSREEPHSQSTLRQGGSPPDHDIDPFKYMTSGSKSFSYAPETNYSSSHPKDSARHGRHNSDHELRPPTIEEPFTQYVPASHKPRHHSSREVPAAGSGGAYYRDAPPPNLYRGATWSGP